MDAGTSRSKKPKGRTLAEFGKLGPAENTLLNAAAAGEVAVVGDGRPEERSDQIVVRAAFIRFLALGGDDDAPVHEKGVRLQGAWIDGVLDLEGVETKGGLCLLRSRFSEAPILRDAHVKGLLAFDGSDVPGLEGDRLICDSGLFLRDGFRATGEVRLSGAKVGGNFECSGGTFQNQDNYALIADGIDVGGGVFLRDRFTATGEVRLVGAKVGGSFECSGGTFQNQDKNALTADGIDVGGDVFLRDGFTATGAVRLLGAKVGGNFECSGGTFQNQDKSALTADGVDVGGAVFLTDGFTATGVVRLLGAKVGSDLVCSGGTFQNRDNNALSADGIDVGGTVFLRDRFMATGEVRLPGAKVGGNFECSGVQIDAGTIDLIGVKVAMLVDDRDSWTSGVRLDGFVYDAFGGAAPTDAAMRIGWLDQQADGHSGKDGNGSAFRPQPWQQLRKVLREMGHYEAAREVGIAFERRKRACGLIGGAPEAQPGWIPAWRRLAWLWPRSRWLYRFAAVQLHKSYGFLVDYGYRPLKLVFWALLVWGVCAGGFFYASRYDGVFVPTETRLYQKHEAVCGPPDHVRWTDCKAIQGEYPLFYPAVYSLNVLLPVGNLGQEAAWRPMTTRWPGIFTQLAVWFETLFGWVASLILVAVVSGLAKKDE